MKRIAAEQPAASTHVVVTGVEWADVSDYNEFVARTRQARAVVLPGGDGDWDSLLVLNSLLPRLFVLPKFGTEEFVIAEGTDSMGGLFSSDPREFECSTTWAADLVARIASPPQPEAPDQPRTFALLMPSDASAACRARCDRLFEQIVGSADDRWIILRRVTGVIRADELTGPDVIHGSARELALG